MRGKFLALTLFVPMLVACQQTKSQNSSLIKSPEAFVEEQKSKIQRNVQLGPEVSEFDATDLRKQSRTQIAQEKPKSYIEVDRKYSNVFPISLEIENVSMQTVAQMLSEVTGVNILVGDEVSGNITAKLVNVPWDKALDAILKTKGLAKHVDTRANIIRIHGQDQLVSLEEFDRKRTQDLIKAIEAERAIEPLYTEVFRLYYTEPDIVSKQIQSVFAGTSESSDGGASSTMVGRVPQVTIDERIKSLIVKATRSELDLVARLIDKIDVRTRQVLIEAFIVEASDDFERNLGARLGLSDTGKINGNVLQTDGALAGSIASSLAATNATSGLNFLLSTGATELRLELTALESQGLTRIVSNPRIFTLDNEEAIVFQGEQIPVVTQTDEGPEVEFKEAGIKLTVTPSIIGDGNVQLNVEITKDTANYAEAIGDNPPIDSRQISTKLLIRDNTVGVIGGVFIEEGADTKEQVPGLGDIPVVGKIFQKNGKSTGRTELLIFLAPRVI